MLLIEHVLGHALSPRILGIKQRISPGKGLLRIIIDRKCAGACTTHYADRVQTRGLINRST